MTKQVVIVGGGTAGWLTAAYLARTLAASAPGGARITLIESAEIATLGVGEGTFPSLQRTLKRIGIDEAAFLRDSNASFKQGIRFDDWVEPPGERGPSSYFHPFQSAASPSGLNLLPYWLLGHAGPGIGWDEAASVQKAVVDAARGPKRITDASYSAPLNYAYHFDAMQFAAMLRKCAIELGVRHLTDTVDEVNLDETGAIGSLTTRAHGELAADLYIDCTGFRAQLIGQAMKSPFTSCQRWLFADRAMGMQVPYDRPDAQIASYTIAAAQDAGWIWDIGLPNRRGVGHVYSSAHMDDGRAEEVLRGYAKDAKGDLALRTFKFQAGYRERPWIKNCVAVGLSGGFFEPLEATGIVFIEVAAVMLANLFPWAGDFEVKAKQFNEIISHRYARAVDFLKMHYTLSRRRDTAFWRDNTDPDTMPERLGELLERWKHRPPESMDFDMNLETFAEASWQYVLYGMGFQTDIDAKAGVLTFHEEAKQRFAEIRAESQRAAAMLPDHRALISQVHQHGFAKPKVAIRG
jgi:tryptophan halogenase